jgi:hypothetical protein
MLLLSWDKEEEEDSTRRTSKKTDQGEGVEHVLVHLVPADLFVILQAKTLGGSAPDHT